MIAASLLKLKSSVKSNEPAPVPKSSCRYQIVFALLKVVTRIDPNGGSWFPVFRFFPHSSECRAASSWTSPVLLWSWRVFISPKTMVRPGPWSITTSNLSLGCLKGAGDHRTMDWNRVWALFKIVWGYTNHQQPIYFGYFWIITIHEYMNSHSQPPLLQISNHRLVPRFHGQVQWCGTAPGGFGKPAAQVQMDHLAPMCNHSWLSEANQNRDFTQKWVFCLHIYIYLPIRTWTAPESSGGLLKVLPFLDG